jgi:hypothetical protein
VSQLLQAGKATIFAGRQHRLLPRTTRHNRDPDFAQRGLNCSTLDFSNM